MKDFWVAGLQNQRRDRLKKLAIFIGILIVIIAVIAVILVYMNNLDFRKWCDGNILKKEISQKDTKSIDIDGDENTALLISKSISSTFVPNLL